jgi:hypothetical protein
MQFLDASASSYSLSQTSSDIQLGDMNLALLRTDIAHCWLRNEYSVWLMKQPQVAMHWNAILLQLVYGLTIYRPVYFYISNSDEIITPKWSLPKRLLTLSIRYDLTVQPTITYIYLCGRIYASCLSYISNRPSGIEQKLNWNVTRVLEEIHHCHFIIYRQVVLSPF